MKEIGDGLVLTFGNRAFLYPGQPLTFLCQVQLSQPCRQRRHKAAYYACIFEIEYAVKLVGCWVALPSEVPLCPADRLWSPKAVMHLPCQAKCNAFRHLTGPTR